MTLPTVMQIYCSELQRKNPNSLRFYGAWRRTPAAPRHVTSLHHKFLILYINIFYICCTYRMTSFRKLSVLVVMMSVMMAPVFKGVDAGCYKVCAATYKPCFDQCDEYEQCLNCTKALWNCFAFCDKKENIEKRNGLFKYVDEDARS